MSRTNLSEGEKRRRGRPSKKVDPGSIGGRVRAARERLGLSTEELAERVGVTDGQISHGEIGRSKFSDPVLKELARHLEDDFGLEWLKSYAAEKKNKKQLPDELIEISRNFLNSANAQLVGFVSAGTPLVIEPQEDDTITVPLGMIKSGHTAYALCVRGESMLEDLIQHGDIVIVYYCQNHFEIPNHHPCIIEIADEGITLKNWVRKGNSIILEPANKDYESRTVNINKIRRVFPVTGVLRFVK